MLFNDIAFRFNIAGAYQTSFNKRRTETCMDDFHVVKNLPIPHQRHKNFFAKRSTVPLVRIVTGPKMPSTTFRSSSESKKFPFGHQ